MKNVSGVVRALCRSTEKGTAKKPMDSALFIVEHGMEGDAHSGRWHRQVSFLGIEAIEDFRRKGADVPFGAFGENMVADTIPFAKLRIGTRLVCGDVWFEITQIGKKCHSHCEIFRQMGDCIMPRMGVFARVLHGGTVKVGDTLAVTGEKLPLDAAILTASDKGAAGDREDVSGKAAERRLKEAGYTIADYAILPDEQSLLEEHMQKLTDRGIALILTTGGTGFGPRDVTPEATRAVSERLVPGIPEAMRALSLRITPTAMLSRAAAGIRKRSLIVNLPGSPKAVEECLSFILPALGHGIDILRGDTGECAGMH